LSVGAAFDDVAQVADLAPVGDEGLPGAVVPGADLIMAA
jgi:hypothetical protein